MDTWVFPFSMLLGSRVGTPPMSQRICYPIISALGKHTKQAFPRLTKWPHKTSAPSPEKITVDIHNLSSKTCSDIYKSSQVLLTLGGWDLELQAWIIHLKAPAHHAGPPRLASRPSEVFHEKNTNFTFQFKYPWHCLYACDKKLSCTEQTPDMSSLLIIR